MIDVSHNFSADIDIDVNGDLLCSDGLTESQQQIIRRLLTPTGDNIWHYTYGLGAGSYVGDSSAKLSKLKALLMGGLIEDATVAKFPTPIVSLSMNGPSVICRVQYVEMASGTNQLITFTV